MLVSDRYRQILRIFGIASEKVVSNQPYNVFEAYCLVCKKAIKLGTLGVRALESHAKSEKHLTVVSGLQQTTAMSDLGVDFRSEPTLRAEVLWVLHTVTRHQSNNVNEEISELFQRMFPDSDIAKSFRCWKDKTAYIVRFGLADFIKRDLISKVTVTFVLMFDESLNRTSKNKQLDLHIHFWEGGQVQSRYLGSQLMGNATSKDLMKHVKVSKCFIIKTIYCHIYSFFFSLAE